MCIDPRWKMLSGFQVISLRFVGSILPHSSRDESAATRALIHFITDFNFFFFVHLRLHIFVFGVVTRQHVFSSHLI